MGGWEGERAPPDDKDTRARLGGTMPEWDPTMRMAHEASGTRQHNPYP